MELGIVLRSAISKHTYLQPRKQDVAKSILEYLILQYGNYFCVKQVNVLESQILEIV